MGEAAFGVDFAADALTDLDELSEYWIGRGEAWRAEKYSRDLVQLARTELSNPIRARLGRRLGDRVFPHAREILAFGVYRIIYRIDDATQRVKVLRFWHAHRRDPSDEA